MIKLVSRKEGEDFGLKVANAALEYTDFLMVGKVVVPILGKGSSLRPISTPLGVALERGDFEQSSRQLVYLDGSYTLGALQVTFQNCRILVASTKNRVEDSLNSAQEFLLLMSEESLFEIKNTMYTDENLIFYFRNGELQSTRRSEVDRINLLMDYSDLYAKGDFEVL